MDNEMMTYYGVYVHAEDPATSIQKLTLRAAESKLGIDLGIDIDNLLFGEAVDYLHYILAKFRRVN